MSNSFITNKNKYLSDIINGILPKQMQLISLSDTSIILVTNNYQTN